MDCPRPRVRTHAGTAPGRERELLERWLIHGDQLARETLSLMFLPVARRIARRYENTGEAVEDLVQVASIGLLKAIDRFDLRRTTSLRAYAERMIDGELRHHLRDASPSLYIPRALYGKVRAVAATAARLTVHLGRGPTSEEIAKEMGIAAAEVMEALAAKDALRLESLEELTRREATSPVRGLGTDDPRFEVIEQRVAVERTWRLLDSRARECLRLRFAEDLTYAEIGERLGLSGTHAARLVNGALVRIRTVAVTEQAS
jgi:RNA polymerase sigma-B factor